MHCKCWLRLRSQCNCDLARISFRALQRQIPVFSLTSFTQNRNDDMRDEGQENVSKQTRHRHACFRSVAKKYRHLIPTKLDSGI